MMNNTLAPYLIGTLISVVALCMVIIFFREYYSLIFRVKLKTRRDFEKFDSDGYLYSLSRVQLEEMTAILSPSNRKKRLTVRWSYSTPSGKTTYTREKHYSLDEVEHYVSYLTPLFEEGNDKIIGLNQLYANQLRAGKEIEDDFPKIYCYSIPHLADKEGLVKVGYAKSKALKRISDQFNTAAHLKIPYEVHLIMPAITVTGEKFMDHRIHRLLKNAGIKNPEGEWFRCSPELIEKAVRSAQLNLAKIRLENGDST